MRRLARLATFLIHGLAILLLWTPAAARADSPPTLDELLNIEPEFPVRDPGPEQPEITEPVRQRLGGETPSGTFETAVRQMDQVASRLGERFDPGIETQRLQQQILARLDQVIAAARKQQGSSSGSSGSSGSSARKQDSGGEQISAPENADANGARAGSAQANGDGRENTGQASPGSVGEVEPNPAGMHQQRTEWGNLPPRLRDELSQGLNERFSPMYRQLTEAYYRRLADGEAEAAAPPDPTLEP